MRNIHSSLLLFAPLFKKCVKPTLYDVTKGSYISENGRLATKLPCSVRCPLFKNSNSLLSTMNESSASPVSDPAMLEDSTGA